MDSAWTCVDHGDGFLQGIRDSTILHNFKGPDGNLFSQPLEEKCYFKNGQVHIKEGKTHLVFSLNIDWFNPYGNKQAGVWKSIDLILLVCLNLPPKECYRQENMYLAGVIPGPHEPSPEQLNHFLSPIVGEFLPFWTEGMWFSRMGDFPDGNIVHAAIVPFIADLPAAHKIHRSAGTTATWLCALCPCKRRTTHGFDPTIWPKRLCAKWLQSAQEWKNVVGPHHQKKLFEKYGVCWTPLLELPYCAPSEFVVVDAMHNLFLGLFKNHCLLILSINITL